MLLARGTTQVTLAELARELDESPRMLVHHFRSRQALIEAAVHLARRQMTDIFGTHLQQRQPRNLHAVVAAVRELVDEPANRPYFRLFAEVTAAASQGSAHFASFAHASVHDWLPELTAALIAGGSDPARAEAEATLALGIVRGLLLDQRATGEAARIEAAYNVFAGLQNPAGERGGS